MILLGPFSPYQALGYNQLFEKQNWPTFVVNAQRPISFGVFSEVRSAPERLGSKFGLVNDKSIIVLNFGINVYKQITLNYNVFASANISC